MKYIILLLLPLTVFANNYGTQFKEENIISLSDALKANSQDEVIVKAKIVKVCQQKGCWMTLQDHNKEVRVTFKGYKFFVPFDIAGSTALIKGKIKEHTMSVKEAKHYAKDEGKSGNNIKDKVKEFRMLASGVKIIK